MTLIIIIVSIIVITVVCLTAVIYFVAVSIMRFIGRRSYVPYNNNAYDIAIVKFIIVWGLRISKSPRRRIKRIFRSPKTEQMRADSRSRGYRH